MCPAAAQETAKDADRWTFWKTISSVRVNEAVALTAVDLGRPLELTGYLIVSSYLVCVVEDQSTARSGRPHFGVLVNRDALGALDTVDIQPAGGSSVSIVGNITLKGTATQTGIPGFPLYVPYIYEFTFATDDGAWAFQIGETFKDIYLLSPPTVAPRSMPMLKPLFDPALTVMQLKRLLESETEHRVGRHLRGDAFSRIVATIEAAGFKWRAEECEIERGIP